MTHDSPGAQSVARQLLLNLRLKDTATFSNYQGGAKKFLISQLSGSDDNLWFTYVWGEKGSGRSHLLQAACRKASDAGLRTAYFSFKTDDSIEAIDDLSGLDLVCLDDIDIMAGSKNWEEALFHLINEIKDRGHLLIVSSRQAPATLPIRLKDLQSRLMTALPVQTTKLGDEEKLGVLKRRAENRGFTLSEEAGRFILHRSHRDLGHLMNALDDLDEQSIRHQKKLTIPFIKKILQI